MGVEERCGSLRGLVEDSARALDVVREELHSFADEQRVFCGYLDTEQQSYQELMRREVDTLSRLVESNLRSSTQLQMPLQDSSTLSWSPAQAQEDWDRAPSPIQSKRSLSLHASAI